MSEGPESPRWKCARMLKVAAGLLTPLIVIAATYFYVGPTLRAWLWAVEHHSTASYAGLQVKVPWMWRQEETPAGQMKVRLRRARFGEPVEVESIEFTKNRASEQQPFGKRLERLRSSLKQEDPQAIPISLNPKAAQRFSCVALHFKHVQGWDALCQSTDSLWTVMSIGPVPDPVGLDTVLQGTVFKNPN